MRGRRAWLFLVFAAMLVLAAAAGAQTKRIVGVQSQVTITLLANFTSQPGYTVLIANFERAYPNITVEASYAPAMTTLFQIEESELAAGNAPDLLSVTAGCYSPISVCALAQAGDLLPLLRVPWSRRSLPIVTSLDKEGQALYAFTPVVIPYVMFTNNALFAKLGLTVPTTFPQLLALCERAAADGTAAVILDGASQTNVSALLASLAVATVYGPDPHWTRELRAGAVTFDGTPGWHTALQEFIDMNTAGCFQPGATGTVTSSAEAEFAEGQGLMYPQVSGVKGNIDADQPQFDYSLHPFPGGTTPGQTANTVSLGTGIGVNAHSSPQSQTAALAFINFIARPQQNAVFGRVGGGLAQYQLVHNQYPSFISAYAPVLRTHRYVFAPTYTWWNPDVLLALEQDGIGLITGQQTIDDVLNAMDQAWKQGPA